MVEYAVVQMDGIWRLFQCGQQIRVFHDLDMATRTAGELARMIQSPEVEVKLWVQSPTGELRRHPLGLLH